MRKHKQPSPKSARAARVACESVRFAEVEFPKVIEPRLVVRFSDGLSLLVEDRQAIDLAAEFIVAFRAHELGKGGAR